MADLSAGDERYRNDQGDAEPAVTAALSDYHDGRAGEYAVLSALAGSRLLVPVVAEPGPDGEKSTDMAAPSLVGRDGRRALPAFTSAESLRRWKSDARPVPVPAGSVWQAAVGESSAVVIDLAGPVPLVVEGSRLAALAQGHVPEMSEDPEVWERAVAAAGEVAPGIRVRVSPPRGGLDFTLELAPPAGEPGPVPEDVADRVGQAVHDRLSDRVRSGIAVLRRPGD